LSDPPPHLSIPPAEGGETHAQNALFASLYDELRQIAQRELRRGAGLTLSATTLLHETYFKVQQRTGIAERLGVAIDTLAELDPALAQLRSLDGLDMLPE